MLPGPSGYLQCKCCLQDSVVLPAFDMEPLLTLGSSSPTINYEQEWVHRLTAKRKLAAEGEGESSS